MYSFFLFNNELTFAPISAGQKSPCAIVLNTDKNGEFTYKTGDLKPLVEKYGAKSTLFSTHHGFENFEFVTPQTMKKMSYSKNNRLGKQHSSSSSMYINTGFEDKTLQEIYVSNLRHRIHTFNRLLAFTTEARPELTPIDTIEIINQSSGDLKELDGLYYNAAVKYVFSETNVTQFRPKMSIYLCSEIDANSIESPEGSAI